MIKGFGLSDFATSGLGCLPLPTVSPERRPFKGLERPTLADLLRLLDQERGEASHGAEEVPILVRRLRAGETLFHQGSRAETVFFVRSGTLKMFHTEADGYEQVLGFRSRPEIVGFDALCTVDHPTEATALEDSTVFGLPIRDLFSIAGRHPALARAVHLAVSLALTRQAELADVMAAAASEVRLARFLLHCSRRMAEDGQSPHRLLLRMSRRDIASYLGVAHETVSRSFKALAEWHLVAVDNREVSLLDLPALDRFSHGTRRHSDELGLPRSAARSASRGRLSGGEG